MKTAILFMWVFGLSLFAQSNQPFYPLKITEDIIIDGVLDEAAWNEIEPLPITMYQPTYSGDASERTELRVAYDEAFFYFGGHFYDSDPEAIRANSLYRDRYSGDDVGGIILDTFNDNENALWFWTTPNGIRGDLAISRDGGSTNDNWDTYWEVATKQSSEGWFMEARIPFSSLGFQAKNEAVTMGMIAYRFIARKNERLIFPDISTDWNWSTPSLAQKIVLENVQNQKPVYITPYLLGGLGQESQLLSNASGYELAEDYENELGLDIKYNLTSNLTLDLTANTDFAQVEADNQQVNLTRFSLFFPEKRRFFQERAGIFSFNTAVWAPDRLFHSRRIGIRDGQAVRIYGGARLVGRAGKWDVGLLDMQTAKSGTVPGLNHGVLRLRRQVLNEHSYFGGMLTSRADKDGVDNLAYGLDGVLRLFGDEYLTLKWAQTRDRDIIDTDGFSFLEASSAQFRWQRRKQGGLNYIASLSRAGADFLPEAGFTTRSDFTELFWWISHDWFRDEGSRFSRISPIQFFGFATFRNDDRSLESAQFEYDTDFVFKTGGSMWADAELYYEDLQDTLSLPEDTFIPTGSYTYAKVEGGYNLALGRLFRGGISAGVGQFYDGWRYEFGVSPIWNVSRFLELNFQYRLNLIRFTDRDQEINSHIMRLRIQSALNTRVSMNAFLQYNSVDDLFVPNVRFRYNFREGNDLWIVYNESINGDRGDTRPFLPRSNNRTILLKYTYTFQQGL